MEEDNSKNVSIPYTEIKNLALSSSLRNILGWGLTACFASGVFVGFSNNAVRLGAALSVVASTLSAISSFSAHQKLKRHLNNFPDSVSQAERPEEGQKISGPDNTPK